MREPSPCLCGAPDCSRCYPDPYLRRLMGQGGRDEDETAGDDRDDDTGDDE